MADLTDFPKTEREFHKRFSDEEACRNYFCAMRWPEGFVCPRCGRKGGWRRHGREEYVCANRACGKETSLRSGTVLHKSPKPLSEWMLAMFHVVISKQGMSALELQRRMGFGCYRTALRWLRELRRCMGNALANRELLSSDVEVDEMAFGGTDEGGKRGAGSRKKVWIVGAVERLSSGCGRTRLRLLPSRTDDVICDFITSNVQKGSIVRSDNARWYKRLPSLGYLLDARTTTNGRGRQLVTDDGQKMAEAFLPRIHRVFSLAKRLFLGAHQGSYSTAHLQGYLDEYCFRFENKNAPNRTKLVPQILRGALKSQCVPYWKSSGRKSPDEPTFTRSSVWTAFGALLRGEVEGG